MSLVTAIKDYIDLINNVYDSLSDNFTFQHIFQQSFIYIYGSIKYLVYYLVSFQWLRDFCYLPLLVPQLSTSILKETFFLENPTAGFFTFLETPGYINNKFLIGLLNSFFLSLPISAAHIICARRLLIQGIPAGVAAGLGNILGQLWFLFCILFGLRLFVIPWFSIEPLSYVFGVFLTLTIIYDMSHERSLRVIDFSKKATLIKIFFLSFILSWTEQTCIFQYIGNITLSPEPTLLEIFSSTSELDFFIIHGNYLLGITIGSLFFTTFFGFCCLKLSNFLLKLSTLSYSKWINQLNTVLLTSVVAYTFTSAPFYGLDYLLLSPFGFVSQDKAFEKTIFLPTTLTDTNNMLGDNSSYKSLDTDIAPFDRGRYLKLDANDSFEELNYQGEYAWTARQDRRAVYRNDKFRKLILDFFQKTNQDAPKLENNTSLLINSKDSTLRNSKTLNQEEKNQRLPVEMLEEDLIQNSTFDASLQNGRTDLSDLEEIDENTDSEQPSFYFFKLNERLNNDSKVDETLAPLLDVSFSEQFLEDISKNINPVLEKKMKQKYYSNPVYKILLSIDIDSFLSRQPSTYSLTPLDEKNLFQKRLILANYYDSLRYYTQLPYVEDFQKFFNGSKSYADRVYNQQFKGTLKIVRRLFALTLNEDENPKEKRVLKFDQPLYKNQKSFKSSGLDQSSLISKRLPREKVNFKTLPEGSFEIAQKESEQEKNPLLHEELEYKKSKKSPFLKLTNPIPFYTGWDEQLRKLVITNRLLPRNLAGYSMKIPYSQVDEYSIFLSSKPDSVVEKSTIKNKKNQSKQKFKNKSTKKVDSQKIAEQDKLINREIINFTAWPIQKSVFTKSTKDSKIPYTVLFESLQNPENSMLAERFQELNNLDWNFETLPPNLKKINPDQINDVVPPIRGGFIWPGHSYLKFNIKNLFNR
jgi:hypothetical protein